MLYERASELSLRQEEVQGLSERLLVSRHLLNEAPAPERPRVARGLMTDRYRVEWSPRPPSPSSFEPQLSSMQRQILARAPDLARSSLRLRLPALQNGSSVFGELRLADGSWMVFQMRGVVDGWHLAAGRVARALLPAMLLLLFSALLIRSTLAPLRTLIRASRQIGRQEQAPVPESGSPEIRSLIHAFNEMQERIHRLIESRTQALAAVSHDLRTPLARLRLRLDAIDAPGLRNALGEDIGEMNEMIASLLAFFGGEDDPEPPVLVDLAVMVSTLVDKAADEGFEATYAGPAHLEASLRVSTIRRAVSNLIENALHYGEAAEVSLAPAPDGGISLSVADRGPGIPEARREDVLQPFVRLDEARARNTGGLGLGLSIVASAVRREGGTLTLSDRPSGGLVATIELPAASRQ